MKKSITIKSFKQKYKSINFFILLIIGCMIISFSCSYLLKSSPFWSSALLNVFGGLFTGLIILLYQFYSKTKLKEATEIVRNLEAINDIPIDYVNILDFCTDYTKPNDDELEEGAISIDTILSDEESATNALEKYLSILEAMDKQLKFIMNFSENILILPLNFHLYQKKLEGTFEYFKKYNIKKMYVPNAYLLRNKSTGEIIEVVSADADYLNNDLLYIESPSPEFREVNITYENNLQIDSEKVYEEWITKMNDIINETKLLNSKLNSEKQMIIEYHNNSKIIN